MASRSLWNINEWIELNKNDFQPPVCAKMMHGSGQLKVFFVGGPNFRKDYHLEEGEEFFYQLRGDMCLKVIEKNQPKDVIIKQGQAFLLPGNIYHSPQRFANTVGLVIERERIRHTEIDGIRYFVENDKPSAAAAKPPCCETAWFYCEDLATQLASIINGYPTASNNSLLPPCHVNTQLQLEPPFYLNEICCVGKIALFDERKWQSKAFVFSGYGTFSDQKPPRNLDIFLVQLSGKTEISVFFDDDYSRVYQLDKNDCLLIEASGKSSFTLHGYDDKSRCLVYWQDPTAKSY